MGKLLQTAPAVLYPVTRSRVFGALLVLVGLLGSAALVAWFAKGGHAAVPTRWVAAGALGLAGAGGAMHFWYRQFTGAIRWDGQIWALVESPAQDDALPLEGSPQVFLDLQSHLWVHVRTEGHRRIIWLWLEQRTQPERWLDLRRAVYSRAKPGVDPDASAPAGSRGA